MHTEIPIHVVYWEGGVSYRPFIVLPASSSWPSHNIAYYKSSGRSNANSLDVYRKDTWFPTVGLLEEGTPLYNVLRKTKKIEAEQINDQDTSLYTDGYILKRNVFSSLFDVQFTNWYKTLLAGNELFSIHRQHKIYGTIAEMYIKDKDAELTKAQADDIIERMNKIKDAASLLELYCQSWWQVQLSAQCGGGLWEMFPEFQQFALSFEIKQINKRFQFVKLGETLPVFHITNDNIRNPKASDKEVRRYLIDHKAYIPELLSEDFTENDKLKKLKIMFLWPSRKEKKETPLNTRKRKRTTSPQLTYRNKRRKTSRSKSHSTSQTRSRVKK